MFKKKIIKRVLLQVFNESQSVKKEVLKEDNNLLIKGISCNKQGWLCKSDESTTIRINNNYYAIMRLSSYNVIASQNMQKAKRIINSTKLIKNLIRSLYSLLKATTRINKRN